MRRVNPDTLSRAGLILDMLAAVMLGFQPMKTLWDTGTRAKYPWLNFLAWSLLFIGFACQLAATYLPKENHSRR